jgi:hypothetical protein
MKIKRLRYLIPCLLTVIMLVSLVGWCVSGQSIKAIDNEDFSAELTELSNDLIKLYPYIESEAPLNLLEHINQNQQMISELTTEEFNQIKEIFSMHPDLFDAPKVLISIFEQIEMERALMSNSMASCPPGPPGGLEAVYIAKGFAQLQEFVMAFIPMDEVVVVAGEGGTVWAHPARIALQALYESTLAAALTLEGMYEVRDACLQANHRALLESHDAFVKFTLDNKVELRRVHLQVIELKEKQEFLVYATESGLPIAHVSLISARASERDPVSFMDVDVVSWEILAGDTGTYILEINLPKGLKNASLFKFEVQHAPDPEVAHFGSVIFDRSNQNTITTGQ